MNAKILSLFLVIVLMATPMIMPNASAGCGIIDINCIGNNPTTFFNPFVSSDKTGSTSIIPDPPKIIPSIANDIIPGVTIDTSSFNPSKLISSATSEINKLKIKIDQQADNVNKLNIRLGILTKELKSINDSNFNKVKEISALSNSVKLIEQSVLDKVDAKISALSVPTNFIEKLVITTVNGELDTVKKSIKSIEKSVINKVDYKIDSLTNSIKLIEKSVINKIDDEFDIVTKSIVSLEQSVAGSVSKEFGIVAGSIKSIEASIIDEIKKDVYTIEKDFQIVEDTLKSVEQKVVKEITTDLKLVKDTTLEIADDVKYGFEKTEWFFTVIVEPILVEAGDIIVPLVIFLFDVLKAVVEIVIFVFNDWELVKFVLIYGTIGVIIAFIGYNIFIFVKSMQGYHRQKLTVQQMLKMTKQNEKIISLLENISKNKTK